MARGKFVIQGDKNRPRSGYPQANHRKKKKCTRCGEIYRRAVRPNWPQPNAGKLCCPYCRSSEVPAQK